jgi:aconitate hydratase 2/2-methylisocitrate dehydratase
MNLYKNYLQEVKERVKQDLHPKPIDDGALAIELVEIIKQHPDHSDRLQALNYFTYYVLPGTTKAAEVKAYFLKDIITKKQVVSEINIEEAFEQLAHMKGGASVSVLLDLALELKDSISSQAAKVLKSLVFLYESDIDRLEKAYRTGHSLAKEIIESYANAEFFTSLPEVEERIEVVTFVAAEGDISTDLLSPGADAHSRADRELHGKSMFEHNKQQQQELLDLIKKYPNKRVMLIAEKGTMGVGSSRMSGVNNVALWIGKKASPYVPFVNFFPIVAGTNGISPIFLTTVDVTGGIGIDLKNWVKKKHANGENTIDEQGDPILEQQFSVATGTLLTIDTKRKKLFKDAQELADISASFTPQKLEFIKAGGAYPVVFGKKLQAIAANILGVEVPVVYAPSKKVLGSNKGLTAVEKIFNKNSLNKNSDEILYAGSDVRVKVNIVGSQDTTGPMTTQELEMMAANTIAPNIDVSYQSGCHTASVWDEETAKNISKLMNFMNDFGLVTGRDPENNYKPLTDVIHKVLNDLTVDDWSVVIGGDSHTRMSKGVSFGADSGTVALALATGEVSMPIPVSVKVTFKGTMGKHIDFRDVVHATQSQMLENFGGENVFQGKVIEVHLGTLASDMAFTFTDWTAEMKAKAAICISEDQMLIKSLEIAIERIQRMIDRGMDNTKKVLQGTIERATHRISEIKSGKRPALTPDDDADYHATFEVNLDVIGEPMIADPDVHHQDVSKQYTHDTIRPISHYKGEKKVDLGFVGSCMVHKGDLKILSRILKNTESKEGSVKFNAPLVVAAPTYNIIEELKQEGDWEILQKYAGFEFDDEAPKQEARDTYRNTLYLERPGCNLCMGNQEKAAKGDTVMSTSTRLFKGRVVKDSERKKGESLLASTPVVVLSALLGRIPTLEEYNTAVTGIDLTKFTPLDRIL